MSGLGSDLDDRGDERSLTLQDARVVTPDAVVEGGLRVAGDRIERVWQAAADYLDVPVGAVEEEMKSDMPLDEIVPPEEIGEMVAYLAGPHARHITGQAINVNSGIAVY